MKSKRQNIRSIDSGRARMQAGSEAMGTPTDGPLVARTAASYLRQQPPWWHCDSLEIRENRPFLLPANSGQPLLNTPSPTR